LKYCKNCRRFVLDEDESCLYCGSADPERLDIPLDELEPGTGAGIPGEKIFFNGKDYVVKKTIGLGGYGLILEVESEDCTRTYAMKVPITIEQFFNNGRDFSKREIEDSERSIESEALVFEKLRSERIIRVHDTGKALCRRDGEEKEFPAIVMELAICTLRDVVLLEAEGKIEISPAEKLKMTSCLVNTIKELHDSGIIHRDIALENIFVVNRSGSIEYVMADFGTSREKSRKNNEKTTGVVGRDKYLDPMRFDKRYRRDPRIDIFTAGIVITEIFIGNLWDNIIDNQWYISFFCREFLDCYASGQIDKKIVNTNFRITGCTFNPVIKIFFSQPVDKSQVESYSSLKLGSLSYNFTLSQVNDSVISYEVTDNLPYYRKFRFSISADLAAEIGRSFDGFSFDFHQSFWNIFS